MHGQISLEFLIVVSVVISILLLITGSVVNIAGPVKLVDERGFEMGVRNKLVSDARVTGTNGSYRRWEVAGK